MRPVVLRGRLDPFAQGLRDTAELGCNGHNPARLRIIGAFMLEDDPGSTRADPRRVAIGHFAFCHKHHAYLP